MTRVLRPLKSGEGGHAPLCEMVESTQAQVYEALGNYLDDLMTPQNIARYAKGDINGRYIVKLDDGRTVMTNPFTVEHPAQSKECLDQYMATHPVAWNNPEKSDRKYGVLKGFAGFLVTGMVQLGLARHVPPDREIAALERPAASLSQQNRLSETTSSWFKLF